MTGLDDAERDRIAMLVRHYLVHTDGGMLLESAGLTVGIRHNRYEVSLTIDGAEVARLRCANWWDRGMDAREAHARWIAERLFVEWTEKMGDSA